MNDTFISRRALLMAAATGVVGLIACSGQDRPSVAPRSSSTSRSVGETKWPGHQPGRIYLGLSSPDPDLTIAMQTYGRVGVHRTFYSFYDGIGEDEAVRADHTAGRLPWVSFKPPNPGVGAWLHIAAGSFDEPLRERARRYAAHAQPIIVTFHHEPSNDGAGAPDSFAKAFARVHDVMADETGLSNVTFAPIIGDWELNLNNEGSDLMGYLSPEVLDRSDLIGVDVYQNSSGETFAERLGRLTEYLDTHGRGDLMLGVGECGCTDTFGTPSAVQWWVESWEWAARHPDRVGVVSYFDSSRNSKENVYWPLDESPAKTEAFRASMNSDVVCDLLTYQQM